MTWHYPILRTFRWVRDGILWGRYDSHLGETLEDSIDRLGEFEHIGDSTSYFPQYEFVHDGFDTSIAYENNRAIRVWQTSDRAFPDDYIPECLSYFGNGLEWEEMTEVPDHVAKLFSFGISQPGRHFERSDKHAWACVGIRGRNLDTMNFHFDICTGRWARLKETRYGVWRIKPDTRTEQVDAGKPDPAAS